MPYRASRRARASALCAKEWSGPSAPILKEMGVELDAICKYECEMRGKVILRGAADYNEARQQANPAFQDYPKLISYCEVIDDVRLSLAFAHSQGFWVACRAGGHSFGGYSVNSGMVIDVSKINYVHVLATEKIARVGAGTNFGHLNAILNEYGLHVPGGACEDVCVAGYMQGGGYGFTSRRFGMNCDNVLEFRMMLRDGRIVTANQEQNSDLFWAVRGGTGGNFGVLLEITYRLYDLENVWSFGWVWDISAAPALLTELQQNFMRTGASRKLGYMASMGEHEGNKVFVIQGIYTGAAEEGRAALASLQAISPPMQTAENSGSYYKMNEWADENPFPLPDVTGNNVKEAKQAGYIARPLSQMDWKLIVDFYKSSPCPSSTVVIEPYGGAINEYPKFGNAFVHRNVDMDFFVDVFWIEKAERAGVVAWLDEFMGLMGPYFNGHVYQNYPRDTLRNYRYMYFGEAFDALLKIKNKYDPPPYFFHYQQSIKPYDAGEEATAACPPELATRCTETDIVYEN